MRRRTLVVLVSAFTLLGILVVAAASIGIGVNTRAGREQVRFLIQQQLGSRVQGRLYVGAVRGGLLTGLSIDSLAIRGEDDSLFLSTGRITLQYNPRDLLDRRLLLRNVEVERPVMRLEQFPRGDWNHQRIFRRRPSARPHVPGRGFGDYVVLDSVTIRDGAFIVTRPWSPNDTVRGAARDSVIRAALADTAREIRRSSSGLMHTYRWTALFTFLPHVRLAHPDSGRFGREFVFERGRVEEQEPPFSFRNAHGTVRQLGDTVFIDVPHFDLPASTGGLQGRTWWGSGLPQRYDIRVHGDSVSLRDVAWIYATLPRVGVGRTDLHIRNSVDNLSVMEYALTNLDVRSTRSRLVGAMTFVVGNPVLGVKDVNLRGAPVNFDLLRTLAGAPFPVDWQGDLVGTVRGPGGPLTRFVVDSAAVTFRDDHVPGAVSRFSGHGELDILDPAFTVFRGFRFSASVLDLRTIQFLYPEFPRLGGTISGAATLDSSWLDVRFSQADVTHRNGPGVPTRVTGRGRVTWGERFMTYDVDLDARPLSVTMISRAYELGLKGVLNGPIAARGTSDNLRLRADLTGPAGRITYEGTVDAYPLSIGARGLGRVDSLQLAALIDRDNVPGVWLTGDYRLDVAGDTNDIGTLRGSASLALERSAVDSIRVFPSRVVARFEDRRLFVDTLRLESTAVTLDARGALGLTADRADSVRFDATADSLGGLRRYLAALVREQAGGPPDSLAGTVNVRGFLHGSLAAFRVAGDLTGRNVVLRREAGRALRGRFDVADPFTAPTGMVWLRSDTLQVGGLALDTLGVTLRMNEGRTGAFTVDARSVNRVTLGVRGEFARTDSVTRLSLRSLTLATDSSQWLLAGPAELRTAGRGITVDSVVVQNGRGGRIALEGAVPDSGRARFLLRADSVPLRDVGLVAQLRTTLGGWGHLTATGAGTTAAPVINADARLAAVAYGRLRMESAVARASYAGRRAQVQLQLARGATTLLSVQGSLPLELQYFGARLLEDSLQLAVRTGDATMELVEALVPGVGEATGRVVANVDVGGTWQHPDVIGMIAIQDAEATVDALGIRLQGIQMDLGLFGHADSLAVRRLVAWSGATPADSISISGYVAYRELTNPVLDLRLDARSFYAIDRRALARLFVSTDRAGVTLRGPWSAATLSGAIIVDRGAIILPDPELARKQTVDVRTQFIEGDTLTRRILADTRSRLFESLSLSGVRVTLGEDVFLRSPEADIKLTGSLNVQRYATRTPSLTVGGADTLRYEPVLDGTLRADRGTYTLNLLEAFRREFQVEDGGTIVFYPFPVVEQPPELNITALHVVKRANQSDLRIRVRLTGPLFPNPNVSLESAESYTMSQTDLVSYLIFGMPSFALGEQETKTTQLALQTIVPSTQALINTLSGRLAGPLGEYLQIRPGALDPEGLGQSENWKSFLLTTRIGGEVQLSENVFASAFTGLCWFDRTNAANGNSTGLDLANSISAKLEYRFSASTALKAGREPSASALTCGKVVTGRAFIPAPSQWGLSLFKSWRF